jgi:hypothetical protein
MCKSVPVYATARAFIAMAIQMETGIDEYLRKRSMPVEGSIPQVGPRAELGEAPLIS